MASGKLWVACEPFGGAGPLLERRDDAKCQVGMKIAGRIQVFRAAARRVRKWADPSASVNLGNARCRVRLRRSWCLAGFTGFSSTWALSANSERGLC